MQTISEQKFLKAFGKRVATLRKARGVTQQQLAEEIGVSTVTIAYVETGKQWVRPKTLGNIAESLKVQISDLFTGM
ncbi:MAG: helix-turn-helix domain-containing protein [Candidatus Saccharimonadales bacterium]